MGEHNFLLVPGPDAVCPLQSVASALPVYHTCVPGRVWHLPPKGSTKVKLVE